jgi:hypothetical protein
MGLLITDEICGFGCSFGHPLGALFDDVGAAAGFGDPFSQPNADVDLISPDGDLPISAATPIGSFHDEGGQVAVLQGEFYGDYEVRIGTQQMFDDGAYVVAYSGIAGSGNRCSTYLQNRRISFVTPMGLPLGQVKVVAVALQSMATPRASSMNIVKRAHYSRLYQIASLFPTSYATNVALTVREEVLYD